MRSAWKWLDASVVVAALVIGFGIWFIMPDFRNNPSVQKIKARQEAARALQAEIAAEEARIAKEREELGLVYVSPAPVQGGIPD